MELKENPGAARHAIEGLVSHQTGYLHAIRKAGAQTLIFESGPTPPLISVAMYKSIVTAPLVSLLDGAAAIYGGRVPCVIGGNATPVARELFKAGPGYLIASSETDQAAFLQIAGEFPGIPVRVNMQAALLGSEDWAAIEREARRAGIDLPTDGELCWVHPGCGLWMPKRSIADARLRRSSKVEICFLVGVLMAASDRAAAVTAASVTRIRH